MATIGRIGNLRSTETGRVEGEKTLDRMVALRTLCGNSFLFHPGAIMARTKRSEVFEADEIGVYHCWNRIVRRSYLCGVDPHTGNDYSHRRDWLFERVKALAQHFAIDVLGYAILSNHFHLVLRNRPDLVAKMSDREVVTAWLMICPKSQKNADGTAKPPTQKEIQAELKGAKHLAELRSRLSDPSWLMRQVCQHMGIRCNREDEMRGHFWESRFDMKRLLDEAAILACMAYVDLNAIRAGLADSLEGYQQVSIGERLRTLDGEKVDTSSWLAPLELAGETDGKPGKVVNRFSREELAEIVTSESERPLGCLPMRLDEYAELLRWLAGIGSKAKVGAESTDSAAASTDPPAATVTILQRLSLDPAQFAEVVANFGKQFSTAAGRPESLEREAARRGRRRLRAPGGPALARRSPKPPAGAPAG